MHEGILLLNFGEPEQAAPDEVVSFLEAIFDANVQLERAGSPEAGRRRARELAERRAPGLLEDYRRMGRSPLRAQTEMQSRALDVELRQRGRQARVVVGMQFSEPSIEHATSELRDAGVHRIVALPLYPLCGQSTTVFALEQARRVTRAMRWKVDVMEITGWHRHPSYAQVRARAVQRFCDHFGIDLADDRTQLVFSAHGTPLQYLRSGNRYDLYVRDHCERLAELLHVERYVLGFQNHDNRPGVEWTLPAIGDAVRAVDAERLVVVPVSFMQELSETLVELDVDLRVEVEARGMRFERVPIPYDDPTFVEMLADLYESSLTGNVACRCRPGAYCLNDALEY
jgi:ferrochelatase